MEVLGVVTARGGSKALPRKNLTPLAGEPLIMHVARAAIRAQTVTRVILSSDDNEIQRVARENGLEVPFVRPQELAQDLTPDFPVFQHALQTLDKQEGYRPDLVVHLRPTCPQLRSEWIDEAVELLRSHPEADSLRGVIPAEASAFKMWEKRGEYLEPVVIGERWNLEEAYNLPRQLLPKFHIQTGCVDVIRYRTIVEQGSMTGKKILAFEMSERTVDIDTAEDLKAAARAIKNN